METHEPVSREEALAALASTRQSRARVAWSGYPSWYWLITGACLGAASYAIQLPNWWGRAIPAAIFVVLVVVARAACRARGICEGWHSNAMRPRDTLILYGPATLILIAASAVSKLNSWTSIAAALLIFVAFAGTGLVLGARAARP
jgi:hypothetical protein